MTGTVYTVKHTYIDNYLDYLLPKWHASVLWSR